MSGHAGSEKAAFAVDYLNVIVYTVEQMGVSRQLLLAGTGIDEDLLNTLDAFVTLSQYRALVQKAQELTQEPALGLYVGKQFNVGTHGILGYAAISNPTVWKAMELGKKYARIRNRIMDVDLREEGRFAIIEFDTFKLSGNLYQFLMEGAVGTYYEILRFLFDNQLPKLEIYLRYKKPPYAEIYQELFQVPVSFSQPKNGIKLPLEAMRRPLASANPFMAEKVERQCNEMLAAFEGKDDLTEVIRQFLLKTPGCFPTQESLASYLHMAPRTIRHQLKKMNTSYQEILNNVRKELAIHYLESTHSTIEEIASLLDYSDSSHFTQAFKKWTGLPPGTYRKKQTSPKS